MTIAASTFAATTLQAKSLPLKVVVGDNRVLVFDEQAPIQGLITFQNIVLGQLLYATDSYTVEPGMLKSSRWNFREHCYELELRDDVVFHNGRKATAEDLEFSMTRGLFSKKYSWVRVFLSNIEGIQSITPGEKYRSKAVSGIQITGPRTLKVKLAEPNPAFLLSLGRATFALVPKEELQDDLYTWKRYPVGAGPYKVVAADQEQGTVSVIKVKADFKGPEQIEFRSNGAGANDDLVLVSADDSTPLKSTILPKATSITGIFFNFQNPLAKSIDFRTAIERLVKRQNLVDGVPEYGINNEILATHQYGRAGVSEKYSLDEARALLKKISAQLPNKIRIPVFNSGFGKKKYGRYLDALSREFSDAGLKVEFFDSSKKFFDDADREFPLRIMSPGADPADPLVIFNLFRNGSPFSKNAPSDDKTYEKLLKEASHADSLEVKTKAVKALSQYVYHQKFFVPLFERHPVIFYNSTRISSLGEQNGGLTFYFDKLELADAKKINSAQPSAKSWLLGAAALESLSRLTCSFRQAALSQVAPLHGQAPSNYLPWMDSFLDHKSTDLIAPHRLEGKLLIDKKIFSAIENVFEKDGNTLGFILPEEKSFRIFREIAKSQELIAQYRNGLDLFFSAGRYWETLFSTLCSFVVPIYSTRPSVRSGGVGFSTLRARGAIFLSPPSDLEHSHIELAINLSHELGHQSLMIYQGADPILEGDLNTPIYSVIRKTMRPAIWSFHAVVAIAFMVMFISDLMKNASLSNDEQAYLAERLDELRKSLAEGALTCKKLNFTPVGQRLFNECAHLAEQLTEVCGATA